MNVGIAIAYYGGASPENRAGVVDCFKNQIAVLQLMGGAYPEMNYAEMMRDALAGLSEDLDVVVIVRQDVGFLAKDVLAIAKQALEEKSVIMASQNQELTFTAIPIWALVKLSEMEQRTYSNTGVLDTGFSDAKSRPFASPWAPLVDHSVRVNPLVKGIYLTPEQAFLHRLLAADVRINYARIPVAVTYKQSWGMSVRIQQGDADKRADNDIKHNYAFCVPTFGALDHHQQDALFNLERAGCTIVEYRNCPYIDVARSELKRIAIDELGCDGVFFIDHDIIFIPADAIKMIEEAEEKQDVVSAVYCMRKTAHSLIGAFAVPLGAVVGFFDDGGLYPALYSGLGFSAIPKAVFEALDKQLPELHSMFTNTNLRPYFALDVNGTFYSGEDASFCARVQGLTIRMIPGTATPNGHDWDVHQAPEKALTRHKVWLDTTVRIFHRGSYDYGIEDHNMAVPRYAHLQSKHVATRGEVMRILTDNLSAQAQAIAVGCVPETKAPHSILEERGPCLNCGKKIEDHELAEGTERSGWVRLCPEDEYSRQYVELIHKEHGDQKAAAS